jgi:hypothetical protein
MITATTITCKKSVSFADEIVSDVYSVGSYEDSDIGMLFYSQEDFRRFKLERRMARNRSQQRIASQRSRIQRRGMYDCLVCNKKESARSRIARMNHLMMIGHQEQAQQHLVEAC